jgi:acetyl esterase
MPLDSEIAAILQQMPQMPAAGSMPIAALRLGVNQATAAAPKLDVPLESITDRSIDGPDGALPVRIYTPKGRAPFPLLVYFHGGGYVIGDLNIADGICRALSYMGDCIVMSVDYRLAPEHPFPVPNDDAFGAVRWASLHAEEIGADPNRLAVGGDSAGANLSAAVTLRARDGGGPKLRAQVLMYPSTSYPDPNSPSFREYADGPMLTAEDSLFYWRQYLGDGAQNRTNPDACPSLAASHRDLPPAFVATAECDPSRDSGEAYAAKLKAAGIPTMLRRYAGMPHGFFTWVGHVQAVDRAMDELCAWLKRQLLPTTR